MDNLIDRLTEVFNGYHNHAREKMGNIRRTRNLASQLRQWLARVAPGATVTLPEKRPGQYLINWDDEIIVSGILWGKSVYILIPASASRLDCCHHIGAAKRKIRANWEQTIATR